MNVNYGSDLTDHWLQLWLIISNLVENSVVFNLFDTFLLQKDKKGTKILT